MFGSVVIDVVIAMALVFFVFSLVTSGLSEVVAWLKTKNTKAIAITTSITTEPNTSSPHTRSGGGTHLRCNCIR